MHCRDTLCCPLVVIQVDSILGEVRSTRWIGSFSSTLPMCCSWYDLTNFVHSRMPPTIRSMDIVDHPAPPVWLSGFPDVLTTYSCGCGWGQTDCNTTLPTHRFFGVHQHVVSTRSRPSQSVLAVPILLRSLLLLIWASTLTLTSPSGVMSSQPFEHVSRLCITFGASGILCRLKSCWLWSELWLWARLTTAKSIFVGGQIAVGLECRRPVGIFGQAIRPHQSTDPRATQAASSKTYLASAVHYGISLPAGWTGQRHLT